MIGRIGLAKADFWDAPAVFGKSLVRGHASAFPLEFENEYTTCPAKHSSKEQDHYDPNVAF